MLKTNSLLGISKFQNEIILYFLMSKSTESYLKAFQKHHSNMKFQKQRPHDFWTFKNALCIWI